MKRNNKKNIKRYIVRSLLRVSRVKFFNRWIIFSADLVLFTLASLFSLITCHFFNLEKDGLSFSVTGYLLASMLISAGIFLSAKTYKGIIRHSSFEEIFNIFSVSLLKIVFLFIFLLFADPKFSLSTLFVLFQDWIFSIFLLISMRSILMLIYHRLLCAVNKPKRVFVLGTKGNSVFLAKDGFQRQRYIAVGFLTRESSLNNMRIAGLPVIQLKDTPHRSFSSLLKKYDVSTVLFPNYDLVKEEKGALVEECIQENIEMLVVQPMKEMIKSSDAQPMIREIEIEDLLGRDEIEINLEEIKEAFQDKEILVTGAAGSIGSEIVRQLADLGVKKIILLDHAESALHNIQIEIEKKHPCLNIQAIIGDVRSQDCLSVIFKKHDPKIVFHAAAYKHVPLMEDNPCEAAQVNIYGTKNLADISMEFGVEKFIMISTDKAVNPTNVMGASKRIAEIYTQSLGSAMKEKADKSRTEFITTRFGNVMGSNGSVIPFFKKQIKEGGPVTVTHPDIIRYFMTIPEACRLVLEAAYLGKGSEIFLFDMGDPVKIDTLAKKMIALAGFIPNRDIQIVYSGLRPGEKLFEELLNDEENTLPTQNEKIKIARVREYNLKDIEEQLARLLLASSKGDVENTVLLMKEMVPEFVSNNSRFARLDDMMKTDKPEVLS